MMQSNNITAKDQQKETLRELLQGYIDTCDDFQLPKVAAKAMIDETWPKKTGPWPERNKWWYDGPVWLEALNRRYKHLAPILNELVEHRHVPRLAGQKLVSGCFTKEVGGEEKQYPYVLLDINDKTRKMMADRAGCSVRTVERYINALVKCGLMIHFNLGRNGRYYSTGYWSQFEKNKGNWQWRKFTFLRKETLVQLRDFESFMRD